MSDSTGCDLRGARLDGIDPLDCDFRGAVVTPAFAESIGANYSSDAVDAVRLAKSLIAARKNQ